MNESQFAKMLAGCEQGTQLFCDAIVPAMYSIYKRALDEGFKDEHAFGICQLWMRTMMGMAVYGIDDPEDEKSDE